jgi:ribose/xylose/arabinose/galactoside ABC-type transport system permease subunit
MQLVHGVKTTSSSRRYLLTLVSRYWSWLFLLLLIVFFSIGGPGFFDLFNFQSIGTDMAFIMLMALGQTFVIISGGIDLSTGYVMGLAAVGSAQILTRMPASAPFLLVVLVAIVGGLVCGQIAGVLNGIMIARLHVPPFIVTLGMLGIARGAAFLLSGGQPVSVQTPGVGQLGNGYLLYYVPTTGFSFFQLPTDLHGARARDIVQLLPYQFIVMVVLIVFCAWLLGRTRFGRHTYAVGGSAEASLRAGIPVLRHTIMIYALAALFAAAAGVLYVFRFTNGAADAGDPLLLDSIAAVVIGGASLFGGEGTIVGTLIGALIIEIIQNGLVIMAVEPFWQFIAVGAVIILAVLIDQAKERIAR